MKPTQFQSRRPSRAFDIDSIIGSKPTHTTSAHLNDTPTTGSDNGTVCPTPPADSRKTATDSNGTAKPAADLAPLQMGREPLAAAATGREGVRALAFPVPLLPPVQPRSHAYGSTIGTEDEPSPRELAWRSVWGATSALGRGLTLAGSSSGAYSSADVRPTPPLQGLSRPVGSLPVGSLALLPPLPLPLPLPVSPSLLGGLGARDSLSSLHLHPWLLARRYHHQNWLGYGPLSGSPEASLLYHYHWHRKPKRIRTAFSPAQLQRLERAFDTNHYMVGQERKQLADKLSLTETQVKVWFQNRRTKHKRMKAEEENDSGNKVREEDDNLVPYPSE